MRPPLRASSTRRPRTAATLASFAAAAVASTLLAGTLVSLPASADPVDPEDPPVQADGTSPDDGYGKLDRERLTSAEEAGDDRVTLLIATEEGAVDQALSALGDLGGRLEARDDSVGYVKVSVPTAAAEDVPTIAAVKAVDVDGIDKIDDPLPRGEGQEAPAPQQPPNRRTPVSNPYMPTRDTGAAQFAQRTNDGTGTTVAILDSGVDLDHPALTRLPDGGRKVVDWYNANSPTSGDGTWLRMSAPTYSGTFTAGGRQWTAPRGGPYSFATLNEGAQDLGAAGSDFGADLDRDGRQRESFGVIQDALTKEVLVDLDGDGDFTDQRRMIDYKVKGDVGYFGVDDEQTPVVERMAFVVQTDRSSYDSGSVPWVGIGIAGTHGSHVAGIATGNALFGGQMDGAAPGAEVMSIKACLAATSCTSSGLIDGVLYAARNGADVVNISIGGLPALNDGNNARAELYDRVIDEYDMQLVISAGNSGAGLNTVGDPSVSSKALSVASSITDDTWLSNYGADVAAAEDLHQFSSRGPREDGGFKPQVSAPGSAISTTPRWLPGAPTAGTYELPPGYSMYNGTSMAAPQTTGAIALLIGAYKEANDGERPSPEAIRTALMSSARYLGGAGAHEQGTGVVDVAGAWSLLSQGVDADSITSSVQVNTVLADQLATPRTGVGIHDREGVTRNYVRTYTLTRTTGAANARPYTVTWLGNDGTFSAPARVRLPLDQPTELKVRVRPTGPGAHSAVMRLDSAATTGIDGLTMNVVVMPDTPAADNGFTVSQQGTVGRNETKSLFVEVPEGATALRVDMEAGGSAAGAGQVRFVRFSPQGLPTDSTSSLACYNPPVTPGGTCAGGTPTSRTTVDPIPGVWEVVVDARRTSDADAAPYAVTATVLGAEVTPDPDEVESATVGTPVEREYTIRNLFAGFRGRAVGGPLYSARIDRPTIANAAQQTSDVQVPAGATAFSVQIGNPSDAGADLDLSVYNCTTGTCVLAGQSAGGTSEEAVRIANPAAGAWRVEVDGYAVPAGTTQYDYRDTISAPGFGTLEVTDTDAQRATGTSWTVPATLTAQRAPGEGRSLLGQVRVVDTAGQQVGAGQVVVRSVAGQ